MSTTKARKIDSLTGLRGFAAIWLLIYHVWVGSGSPAFTVVGIPLTPLLNGSFGVDIFFVLSGFVVFLPCAYAMQNHSTISWRAFYVRRFARLFPAYYLQLFFIYLFIYTGIYHISTDSLTTVQHLFLLQNFPPEKSISIVGVYWTLPVEMNFYLSIPFIFLLIHKFGLRPVFICALIIAALFRYGIALVYHDATFTERWLSMDQLAGRLDEFLWGIASSLMFVKLETHRMKEKLRRWEPLGLVLGAAGVLICVAVFMRIGAEVYVGGHPALIWLEPLLGACIALLILSLSLQGKVGNALFANRCSLFLGEISYGIYLWHTICFAMLLRYLPLISHIPTPIAALLGACVTITIASISYQLVELPIMSRAKKALPLFR